MTKKRPCNICGDDLNLWGEDRKGICPTCAALRRESKMVCAGRCKRQYAFKNLEPVSIFITPGKKGGNKMVLYYCSSCITILRSRTTDCHDIQQGVLKSVVERRKRNVSMEKFAEKHGGGGFSDY